MKLKIISFTRAGSRLCLRLTEAFMAQGEDCRGYVRPRFLAELQEDAGELSEWGVQGWALSLEDWTRAHFEQADGLIYIGAAGIAVRAVAPHLKDKLTDPAVVVVDEQGTYAISLLSGHVGGANDLARRTAWVLGAQPVITTASDRQGLVAVDQWAREQGLFLSDRTAAVQTAAALVNGEPVGFFSDDREKWQAPEGYQENRLCRCNVWVTWKQGSLPGTEGIPEFISLRLIPKVLTVGIGCRKGTSAETILEAVKQVFAEYRLDTHAIGQVATIDIKKEEAGLLQAAEVLGAGLAVYSAEELKQVTGSFQESAFVGKITGVGNVCERAALKCAGENGRLLIKKQIYPGVTVAAALSGSSGQETAAERI